jgi:hypothetical protein
MISTFFADGFSGLGYGRVNEQIATHPDNDILRGNRDLMEAYPVYQIGEMGLTPLGRLLPDKILSTLTSRDRLIGLIGRNDNGRRR